MVYRFRYVLRMSPYSPWPFCEEKIIRNDTFSMVDERWTDLWKIRLDLRMTGHGQHVHRIRLTVLVTELKPERKTSACKTSDG